MQNKFKNEKKYLIDCENLNSHLSFATESMEKSAKDSAGYEHVL
jgi:hypothetical protein